MSTRVEIGRSPIAVSRSCSQAGLGPLRTPRKTRPTNSGQAAGWSAGKSSVIWSAASNSPGTGLKSRGLRRADPGRGQLPGDPEHTEAVAAVRA